MSAIEPPTPPAPTRRTRIGASFPDKSSRAAKGLRKRVLAVTVWGHSGQFARTHHPNATAPTRTVTAVLEES